MEGSFWEERGVRASPSQVLVPCFWACGSQGTNGGLCFGTQLPWEAPWNWAGFKLGSPAHWGPTTSGVRRVEFSPPQKADAAGWGQQARVQMHFVSPPSLRCGPGPPPPFLAPSPRCCSFSACVSGINYFCRCLPCCVGCSLPRGRAGPPRPIPDVPAPAPTPPREEHSV